MSTKQLKLKIVTPERLILEELVDQVSLPTTLGEITVLPDHIPLITALTSGDVVAFSAGEHIPMAVVGGFVEIKKNNENITEVAVLADFAEHVHEMSDEKIEQAKQNAEDMRKQMLARSSGGEKQSHVDFEHFEAELERSLTRVKIADKWRTRKYRR